MLPSAPSLLKTSYDRHDSDGGVWAVYLWVLNASWNRTIYIQETLESKTTNDRFRGLPRQINVALKRQWFPGLWKTNSSCSTEVIVKNPRHKVKYQHSLFTPIEGFQVLVRAPASRSEETDQDRNLSGLLGNNILKSAKRGRPVPESRLSYLDDWQEGESKGQIQNSEPREEVNHSYSTSSV